MGNLIKGQEDYLYVWALGVKGMGDGSDKLVTIDVNPASSRYGKVLNKVSVRGQGEAHHMGFTDDRRFLWAGGLDSSRISIFDVGSDPARPKLVRTISDMPAKTGYVGPHTFYAMPGRMIVQGLSNNKDGGGVTGMALYSNKGELIATYPMPMTDGGDGYGYDVAINPQKNVMLTSSFTGRKNYMRALGELVKDAEAMKRFGNTMVVWDLKAMKPKKVLSVPGAPLEIRWSLKDGDSWAITASALTSKLWLVSRMPRASGRPRRSPSSAIRRRSPAVWTSASRTAPALGQHVHGRQDPLFRPSNPEQPKQTYERVTGKQVNMIPQSWDGTRVYIASPPSRTGTRAARTTSSSCGFSWDGKEPAGLRGRFPQGEARPRAPHEARPKAMKARGMAFGLHRDRFR
jgi:selenium-binding protein 1